MEEGAKHALNVRLVPRSNIRTWTYLLLYLGGAFHVWSTPNGTFWDVLIWPWYVGRYIATHFTVLGGV